MQLRHGTLVPPWAESGAESMKVRFQGEVTPVTSSLSLVGGTKQLDSPV